MSSKPTNILDQTLLTCKSAFRFMLLFSFATNILLLAMPLYSMQVFNRVISSGSMETLIMLSLLAIAGFLTLGLMQAARSMALIKISEWLDNKLSPHFLYNTISISAMNSSPLGSQSLRDLTTLRQFLTGSAINALLDAPWAIIYIVVIFIIHPMNGYVAISGGVLLLCFAVLNEYATKETLGSANELSIKSMSYVDTATRNAEVVEAMGMMPAILKAWQKVNRQVIGEQTLASNRATIISGFSKVVRMILQIAVTGLGAYYVLRNELSTGGIIASSILIGRALAPFETAIETWKSVISARKSYSRLKQMLELPYNRNDAMSLPAPEGNLSVEKVVFAPQNSQKPTLKGINFAIDAGDVLGIIGPSAAGKSTLAKLLVGIWKPASGHVRLDGADVFSWNRNEFGQYVGYLPQDVELFPGTVKENIARMQEDASPEAIVDAAKMANVHDLILHLPNGYETQIGPGGSILSAGQRQRVGLARAFFGDPRLVVLDEPNANLDEAGERALLQTLLNAKTRKITTLIISHRPAILQAVDKILYLNDGVVAGFGPRNDVIAQLNQQTAQVRQLATSTAK